MLTGRKRDASLSELLISAATVTGDDLGTNIRPQVTPGYLVASNDSSDGDMSLRREVTIEGRSRERAERPEGERDNVDGAGDRVLGESKWRLQRVPRVKP